MIFKYEDCSNELAEMMEKAQYDMVVKEHTSRNELIIQAMDLLNKSAESFESCGSKIRAAEVSRLMESIANCPCKQRKEHHGKHDDVKKVFMFLGFDPDELENLSSSIIDDLDGEG